MYLVRDARGEVGVKSGEGVCKLCVGFIDTDVEDGVNSLKESCGEVFCEGGEGSGEVWDEAVGCVAMDMECIYVLMCSS